MSKLDIYFECLNSMKGGITMQKLKKFLSVFLTVLTVASIFSIDVSAGYIGVDNGIGNAHTQTDDYNIYLGSDVSGTDYYVVGYRFSIVDPQGNTVTNSDQSKFRTIDLIRYGDSIGSSNYWGKSEYHANRMAFTDGSGKDGLSALKMKCRYNKYQWNDIYRNGKDIDITRVQKRSEAGTNTYGMYYASVTSSANTPSSGGKAVYSRLPATSDIETWITSAKNRAQLLTALGYSGTTESNVKEKLGHNRIVIEPLFRVKWEKAYTVFTATDLAIMNYVYKQNGGYYFKSANDANGASPDYGQVLHLGHKTIRYYSNREFPQSLYADANLRMPTSAPLTVYTTMKSKTDYYGKDTVSQSCWTYDQIIKSTLGMALYYDTPTIGVNLYVKYKTQIGNLKCNQSSSDYGVNSSNNVITKNGVDFAHKWGPYASGNLVDTPTFGLTAPTGYHWNTISYNGNNYRSWRFYSYGKDGNRPLQKMQRS